jgi:hypothetical protein
MGINALGKLQNAIIMRVLLPALISHSSLPSFLLHLPRFATMNNRLLAFILAEIALPAFLSASSSAQEAAKADSQKASPSEEPVKKQTAPVEPSDSPEKKAESTEKRPASESKSSEEIDKKSESDEKKPEPSKPKREPPKGEDKSDSKAGTDPSKASTMEKVLIDKIGSNTNPMIPGLPWRIHDIKRPRPKAVTPGSTDAAPPADARILFDGKDLSEWYHPGIDDEAFQPLWKIRDGYFEVEPRTGSLLTVDSFASCQLHIEWMIPEGTVGTSQGRGNSGIKFMERYEIQILDSFKNRTYADGQAGSIYGQFPPLVNANREQGQWQSYEIVFEAPKYDTGKLTRPPYFTVFHNGILVQNHIELTGPTGLRGSPRDVVPPAAPIMLQDHGNRIRFRNIWIRDLP